MSEKFKGKRKLEQKQIEEEGKITLALLHPLRAMTI